MNFKRSSNKSYYWKSANELKSMYSKFNVWFYFIRFLNAYPKWYNLANNAGSYLNVFLKLNFLHDLETISSKRIDIADSSNEELLDKSSSNNLK